MDEQQITGIATVCVAVLIIGIFAWKRTRSPSKEEIDAEKEATKEAERLAFEALPRCPCGEVAKFPAPILRRDRGSWDWLRQYFAAAPRYRREVNLSGTFVFCAAHVHVADALVDQFIFQTRHAYSTLNMRTAGDAAAFEQEGLLKLVNESLTDDQKRAVRKTTSPPLRVLPALTAKTGTEDTVDGG